MENRNTIIILIASVLMFLTICNIRLSGQEQFEKGLDDPQELAKFALSSKSLYDSGAYYAMLLRASSKEGGNGGKYKTEKKNPVEVPVELLVDTAMKLSQKKGMFNRVALISSMEGNKCNEIVEGLTARKDPAARKLAAAILVSRSFSAYLNKLKQEELSSYQPPAEGEEGGEHEGAKGKAKGKGPGPKKKQNEPQETIPAVLFSDSSDETASMAIMAAAYSADSSAKQQVEACPLASPLVNAVKIFYSAMTGDRVPAEKLQAAFKASASVKNPVTEVDSVLSEYNPLVPELCLLCMAMGEMKDPANLPLLYQALSSPDIRVQMDAVRAIRRIGSDTSLPELHKKLVNCKWPVLVEVCSALGEIPSVESLDPLVKRWKLEKGRFRLDISFAIYSILGRIPENTFTAEKFEKWLSENKKDIAVDSSKTAKFRKEKRIQDMPIPSLGMFYALSIYSDRMCYVVDSSLSMNGDRITNLKENLESSMTGLAEHVFFDIVDFGGEIHIFEDRRIGRNMKGAVAYVKKIKLTWATRSFDAMEYSYRLPDIDSMYFLSDGAPVNGQFDRWHNIILAMNVLNHYRPIAIYCVDFYASESNLKGMGELSVKNVGLNCSVQ